MLCCESEIYGVFDGGGYVLSLFCLIFGEKWDVEFFWAQNNNNKNTNLSF